MRTAQRRPWLEFKSLDSYKVSPLTREGNRASAGLDLEHALLGDIDSISSVESASGSSCALTASRACDPRAVATVDVAGDVGGPLLAYSDGNTPMQRLNMRAKYEASINPTA